MRLNAIVAMDENRVIGKNNQLPWRLPADLQHFKKTTLHYPIIMGRKTFESIGRPLPQRCNIVITRNPPLPDSTGCIVVNSISAALHAASFSEEVFVIGGAQLYEQLLPRIQRIFLTRVHHQFTGDAFFPELDSDTWEEIEKIDRPADEKNCYAMSFITLQRNK